VKLKKPLPKWAPLAGIVVAGLVVAVGGWTFVVSPQNHKAADLVAQTAEVQQKITTQLAAVAAAKSAAAAPPAQTIRVADVYKLVKAMPSNDDIPDLLIELSQITKDAGVEVQALSPAPATPGATGGATVPVTMTVSGDFYSVTDLLYRLRNLVFVRNGALEANGRLFAIDNVNLAPSGRNVTASISMHAFVYGAPAAVTPAVPTPAPSTTGTDTTATTTTTETPSSGPSATGGP
jgi:Tfp pilus assembly protein PilO